MLTFSERGIKKWELKKAFLTLARPITIQNETILEAAREVFLARGIQATTAEIAERAGVSEGSLFNRFKTKHELFRAAFELSGYEPLWVRSLPSKVGKGKLEDTLFELAMEMMDFFSKLMPLMMLAHATPGEHGFRDRKFTQHDSPPARAIKALASYFSAEMRLNRMRKHDPEIVARTLVGGIWQHVAYAQMVLPPDELPMAPETFVRGMVHLLFVGAEPRHAE